MDRKPSGNVNEVTYLPTGPGSERDKCGRIWSGGGIQYPGARQRPAMK